MAFKKRGAKIDGKKIGGKRTYKKEFWVILFIIIVVVAFIYFFNSRGVGKAVGGFTCGTTANPGLCCKGNYNTVASCNNDPGCVWDTSLNMCISRLAQCTSGQERCNGINYAEKCVNGQWQRKDCWAACSECKMASGKAVCTPTCNRVSDEQKCTSNACANVCCWDSSVCRTTSTITCGSLGDTHDCDQSNCGTKKNCCLVTGALVDNYCTENKACSRYTNENECSGCAGNCCWANGCYGKQQSAGSYNTKASCENCGSSDYCWFNKPVYNPGQTGPTSSCFKEGDDITKCCYDSESKQEIDTSSGGILKACNIALQCPYDYITVYYRGFVDCPSEYSVS